MTMKKITIGILAHVDAGKTTLSESLLYLSGNIRKLGRVDHGSTFLDYDNQEKQRGITIYSKQAKIQWKNCEMTFIDTPGHIDFSAEMERTLQVLDYAIVVMNGLDGVQNHTKTIWELLKHYQIPTFIFVNKMDMPQVNQKQLMNDFISLDEKCFDFSQLTNQVLENIALVDEQLLNEFLETGNISQFSLAKAIQRRQIFPCFFGSALKIIGVQEFLDAITSLMIEKQYPHQFGARIFKITTDEQGHRLTHMKITGGSLKVKETIHDEKIDQLRLYKGLKYELVNEVYAGDVVAVTGLKKTTAGMGLGYEQQNSQPVLSSYINYRLVLPQDCSYHEMVEKLKILADEDPSLHMNFHQDITVQLMGEIQIEVLKNVIKERFHVDVEFDQGQIVYKETIQEPVIGVGHFEPLRHYAEVHILLEPLERGSGLQFISDCSTDILDQHWQRLILTHMEEKEHLGVLTRSPITDMRLTLLVGKAHLKHTEGGDFRQATYRAIRQGLKKAQSLLLEPYYQYRLEIPQNYLSKAIFDIENMKGDYEIKETLEDKVILEGKAPVRLMKNYQNEVISYTKGQGKIYCSLKGYEECLNQNDIISEMAYDSESDIENPTGSVFCSHGAGFYVPWNEVQNYQHLESGIKNHDYQEVPIQKTYQSSDDELEDIFTRTYGPVKRRLSDDFTYRQEEHVPVKIVKPLPECLLVDGYNVIHSWSELKDLAKHNLDAARTRLIDILGNYQGYKQCTLIIVFDAYKVKGNIGTSEQIHNVHVVYTKEAQTADMYIERTTHELSQNYNVIVATSDALEQMIVIGHGARRMSSRELKLEVESLTSRQKEEFDRKQEKSRNFLLEDIQNFEPKE